MFKDVQFDNCLLFYSLKRILIPTYCNLQKEKNTLSASSWDPYPETYLLKLSRVSSKNKKLLDVLNLSVDDHRKRDSVTPDESADPLFSI